MKITVELDVNKLRNVMKLKGLKTRRDALDFALAEAERRARLEVLLREPPPKIKGAWIRKGYELGTLREMETPKYKRKAGR